MKRVNVKESLKQRMNEVLGDDSGTELGVDGITPWSIQAAMIANLRRIVSAIAADSISGRPMKGLWMSLGGGALIGISTGYGFTKNGDIVVLDASLTYTADVSSDDEWYLYLKHTMAEVDGDIYPDGKRTGFIGRQGTENIVYDDKAASQKDNVQSIVGSLVQQSTIVNDNPDWVYLGTMTTSGGSVISSSPSDRRGLSLNPVTGDWLVPKIRVTSDASLGGNLTVGGIVYTNIIKDQGAGFITVQDPVIFDENVTFGATKIVDLPGSGGDIKVGGVSGADFVGDLAGKTTTVVNGIITSVV